MLNVVKLIDENNKNNNENNNEYNDDEYNDNEKIYDKKTYDENNRQTMFKIFKYILITHNNYDAYGKIFNELLNYVIDQLSEYIEATNDINNFSDEYVHLMLSPLSAKIKKYLENNKYRDPSHCKYIYVQHDIGYEVNIINEHEITLNICYTYWYQNFLVVKYNVVTNQFYMMSWHYGSVNGRGGYYKSSNVNILIEGGIDEVKNMCNIILHDGQHLDKKYKMLIANYHILNDICYISEPITLMDHVINHIVRSYYEIYKNHAKLNNAHIHKYMSISRLSNNIILHVLVNRKNIYDFHLLILNGEQFLENQTIDLDRTDLIVLQCIMKNGTELFSIPDKTTNMSLNNITQLHTDAYDRLENSICKFPSFCDNIVNVSNNIYSKNEGDRHITHYIFL